MIEIARVTLNNEMDLILAHRRSMKLAELTGLSLPAQTTFATAVSEVSRSAIENVKNSCLILSIANPVRQEKYIVASIQNGDMLFAESDGFEHAKKLVNKFHVSKSESQSTIELHFFIPSSNKINHPQINEWKKLFTQDRPISPYEEIKRKNEQLQLLAVKLQESEEQYKTLTNSLPLIIFSMDKKGDVIYSNEWLTQYTGLTTTQLNENKWKDVVHKKDYDSFVLLLNEKITSTASNIKLQCRLKNIESQQYLWHLISLSPLNDEKGITLYWIGFMVDINTQKVFEETLKDNRELKETQLQLKQNEQNLQVIIMELNRSNRELQEFAYVASHDLQEPVRKIIYYSDYLLVKNKDKLDNDSQAYLSIMINASHRMRNLIRDLLSYSEINQQSGFTEIDLNELMQEALQDLELSIRSREAIVECSQLPVIEGNVMLMRQLFTNIIANSIKYSKADIRLQLSITHQCFDNRIEISFRDNGVGFDEIYVNKIFSLFQRLHSREKYEGTGLGLAICRKIVEVHGGSLVATSQIGEGATFIATLPIKQGK